MERPDGFSENVNKYMLFLRIVLAEMFKDLRVGGWCIQEVKDRMDILSRSSSHRHNSSSSVGIVMQLTRVLWDELMPQLEQQPKASRQVILTLLEPFVCLAEGSFVEGLVRSIHENIFKKCPWELLGPLSNRLLEAAARTDIFQKNREALYEMVDEMEKRAREPAPETLLLDEAENISGTNHPTSEAKKPSKRKRTKRLKVDKVKKASSQMSPLMLPKAAEPSVPAFKEHSEHTSKRSPSDAANQVKRTIKRKVKTTAANAISGKSEQNAQKPRTKSQKNEVSFNPMDKVVKYSEGAPVSQMKGSAVKRKRPRLENLESTPSTDPKQGKKSSKRKKK
eukprot:s275_g14.t1